MRSLLALGAALTYITLMLLADAPGPAVQLSLGAATALFLYLLVRRTEQPWRLIVRTIVIATSMEVIGSVIWGLYTYRNAVIPFYVPFGHGVFFALAACFADDPFWRRHATQVVRSVLVAGTLYAIFNIAFMRDISGGIMWAIAAALMLRSRSALLLAFCCVFTTALELVGTAIGNWAWAPVVPLLGITSANPPCGAAVCYCILDLLVNLSIPTSEWAQPRRLRTSDGAE